MRLKSLFISEYKNLKDFNLTFDNDSFIDVFVGKNATGKSNLFEALIEIFRFLYALDSGKAVINFDFRIEYEIESKTTKIEWKDSKLNINGEKPRKTLGKTSLPDNVLIYYSGHNNKVSEIVSAYESSFKKLIKKTDAGTTRKFIGIGKEYKQLLLSVLLLQSEDNKARQFICRKLGIASTSTEIKIILKRPFYADRKYQIDPGNSTTSYWGAIGITKDFLDRLFACQSTAKVRDEGYLKDKDKYFLYCDIAKIRKEFYSDSPQDVFRMFDNLKTIEMLENISIDLSLNNAVVATTDHFSDGQFQSVYIYSIIELFKDRNCITLLDEPDSFLHPEWQFDFLKQVFEITDTTAKNNHVLMTSHSAVTLVPLNQKHIKLFQFADNKICCHKVNKCYAINQLSSNMIRFSEDEQILSILLTTNIENKPVFFTEGSTDPIILRTAWGKLYSEQMPFIPIYAFSCQYLRHLLQDDRIYNEMKGKPIFGLFDFDEAYNDWNGIKGNRIEIDPYKGMSIHIENRNGFAFLLPVPSIDEIEKQVMKNPKTKETFLNKSKLSIEHLFYKDLSTHKYFEIESIPGGGSVLIFKDSAKTDFAKNIIPQINSTHFEVFRPIFEFIKTKCI